MLKVLEGGEDLPAEAGGLGTLHEAP
jgi:hypothetical protein